MYIHIHTHTYILSSPSVCPTASSIRLTACDQSVLRSLKLRNESISLSSDIHCCVSMYSKQPLVIFIGLIPYGLRSGIYWLI